MKKVVRYVGGAVILLALLSCAMPNPFTSSPVGQPALPPDQISDSVRSTSGAFAFETLLPVDLDLQIDLYQWDPKSPSTLQSLPTQEQTIIITLQDSKGNQVYAGKLSPEGILRAELQLPSAPQAA